jgi:hypothetical protein
LLAVTALSLVARPVAACRVPVFRYALERWPADMYRLVVFHRGPFTEKQKVLLERLRACPGSDCETPPLGVFPVDVSGEIPEEIVRVWEKSASAELPHAVLMYPARTMPNGIAWAGSLAEAARVALELSPVRRELARRLIDGQTAVWLFVEKGDDDVDTAKALALSETLKRMENELRLPHEVDPTDTQYDAAMEDAIELRIEFSIMRVSLDDLNETLLISTLRGLLGDEMTESLPLVVPVFGRGRALATIPAEQITEDSISEVCRFLVGPCSCEVKARNPGFDLLLPVDWDGLVTGTVGPDEALPPLAVPAIAPAARAESTDATMNIDATEIVAATPLARRLVIMGAVALALLVAATAYVLRKHSGSKAR